MPTFAALRCYCQSGASAASLHSKNSNHRMSSATRDGALIIQHSHGALLHDEWIDLQIWSRCNAVTKQIVVGRPSLLAVYTCASLRLTAKL